MKLIETSSISYEQVRQDIIDYLNSSSGVDASKWIDRYSTGAGMTVVELIAGLASYLSFHSMNTRKEAFVETARLRTSLYSLASMRGYPVNRPNAPYVWLNLSGNVSKYKKLAGETGIIAEAFGRKIVVGESYSEAMGIGEDSTPEAYKNSYKCYFGIWVQPETVEAIQSQDFYTMEIYPERDSEGNTLYVDNDSSHIIVLVSDSNLPLTVTKNAEDLIRTKTIYDGSSVIISTLAQVLERSLPDGISLVFGSKTGNIGYALGQNEKVSIKFLATRGQTDQTVISLDDITPVAKDITIDSVVSFTDSIPYFYSGSVEDSLSKIRNVVPGYYSSFRRMVSVSDHKYMVMGASGEILSANCRKDPGYYTNDSDSSCGCCTVEVGYLRGSFNPDGSITEKNSAPDSSVFEQDVRNSLYPYKPVGEMLNFTSAYGVKVKFNIIVYTTTSANTDDLTTSIQQIIINELYKLQSPLRLGRISTEISKLTGVSRVYINTPTEDFMTQFKEYLYIEDKVNDIQITFKSSDTEVEYDRPQELGYVNPAPRLESELVRFIHPAGTAITSISSNSSIIPGRDFLVKYNASSALSFTGETYSTPIQGLTCTLRTVNSQSYLTFQGTPASRIYVEDYIKFSKTVSSTIITSDYQTIAYSII